MFRFSVCVFDYSLDCVLPAAPLTLVQFLHLEPELGQTELFDGELIVRPTALRHHTLSHGWGSEGGRDGCQGTKTKDEKLENFRRKH